MSVQELAIYGFTMSSAGCTAVLVYPAVVRGWMALAGRIEAIQQGRVELATRALDELFVDVMPTWLKIMYGVAPLTAGVLAYLLSTNLAVVLIAAAIGLVVPDLCVRQARAIRRRRFHAQLVDALFILSSSLRAGLSLTQAFEQLESEMPPPASQEFGLMMKAHRLGRSIEDALQGLNDRMPSQELQLVTTAVLVARETGGNVVGIINQLISTIRERKKLQEKVGTLTLQGKLQAYIMSILPIAFAAFVRTSNPGYFDLMFHDPVGQRLLTTAVGLWLVGMVLLFRLSKVEV